MRNRVEYYAHLTVLGVGIAALLYLFLKYALTLVLPFALALVVVAITRPLARALAERLGAPEKVIRVMLCVLIVIGVLAVFIGGVTYALGEVWSLLREIAHSGVISKLFDGLAEVFPEGGEISEYAKDAFNGALSGLASSIGAALSSFAKGLPRVLLFILVTVTSTFYFALDIERTNKFLSSLMPKSLHGWLLRNKSRIKGTVFKYIRAYVLLMLVTFAEMFVGFILIGVDYAALLALIVAALDALPLIGVGVILIPMAVYNFLVGEGSAAIGLCVLFLAHTVIRQIIEPRIVGKNLGIHPIVSLVLIYFGYRLFGAVGILLVPVFSVLINAIVNKDDSSEVL